MARKKPETHREYLERYPRLCAHIIAESLGYATRDIATSILQDGRKGRETWPEWVLSCYNGNPKVPVERAIHDRHHYKGYVASYQQALAIVRYQLDTGEGLLFASWF